MAIQQLATLWTPDVWIPGIAEKQATFPSLFNSKAVIRPNRLTELASGEGTIANVPFLKDITDQANEVQIEHTAPTTVNGAPGDVCKFPILNRVTKNAWTAMAKNVSGADIMDHVFSTMGMRRLKQYQTTLVAMLRGLFGSAGVANAAAALSDARFGGTTAEVFTETGAAATESQLMSPDLFIDATALLGELEDTLMNGALFIHPVILARLRKLDVNGFKTTVMPSQLPFTIRTYRDCPIFTSQALRRTGTVNGFVYDTYILGTGTIGFGDKPQVADVADLASLATFFDRDLNDDLVWDRNRISFGVDGTAFDASSLGASSATDAELQTAAKWSLKYASANRVGVACVRTNG